MASLTILIIDDDHRAHRTARMAAYLLAEQQGTEVRVLTATSAVEGAELLRSPEPIDLVLLDIHLPGHIDGRLASGLISELRPGAPILPFTADRTEQTAAHLRSIGLAPPVFKPIDPEPLAEHIARALERPAGEASPLQGFLAEQARLVADLTEPTAARRALRVAVLAREHLALLGLTVLLREVGHARPLQIELATSRPEELGTLVRGGGPDLLVSAADVGEAAEPLVRSHGIPLLIYATRAQAALALASPYSVVVGPASNAELDQAIGAALAGERYRAAHIEQVLHLTPRQGDILRRMAHGDSTIQIAYAIGLSEPRLRHLIAELYVQLALPSSRQGLVAWAREAPLHLLDEPA
jgi:DNA-binding NarL/FixJ family response regulator